MWPKVARWKKLREEEIQDGKQGIGSMEFHGPLPMWKKPLKRVLNQRLICKIYFFIDFINVVFPETLIKLAILRYEFMF